MKTLVDLFNLGMLREHLEVVPDVDHLSNIVLNLGPGNKHIGGAIELEWPAWDAESMPIPFHDDTVAQIHAYHFLEHISNIRFLMSECHRVLMVGGHMNIVVPYYSSAMQAQDLDHKSAFTEKTFKHLYSAEYYEKDKLEPMRVHTNFIMGDCETNLCLVIQLVKL